MCATCTTPSGLIDGTARRGAVEDLSYIEDRAGTEFDPELRVPLSDDAAVGSHSGGHDRRARPIPVAADGRR